MNLPFDYLYLNVIFIIFIKQPMTSNNKKYLSLSYKEEYHTIMEKFQNRVYIPLKERMLIVHYHIIQELERIAHEENIPMVDNIAIVEHHRIGLGACIAL